MFDMSKNYNTLDCGSGPSEEQLPCPGFARYEARIQPIVDKWLKLLQKFFENHKKFGHFSIVKRTGSWGVEHVAYFTYDNRDEQCQNYAKFVEENLPKKWITDKDTISFYPPKDRDKEQELILDEYDMIFGDYDKPSGLMPPMGPWTPLL
jgi:hypothetical protein